jgi:hypothetical protein
MEGRCRRLEVSDAKRLKVLEKAKAKLKKLLAEANRLSCSVAAFLGDNPGGAVAPLPQNGIPAADRAAAAGWRSPARINLGAAEPLETITRRP